MQHKRRTCTCKNIRWNLSTNTAAEYGDLGALIRRQRTATDAGKQDEVFKISSSTATTTNGTTNGTTDTSLILVDSSNSSNSSSTTSTNNHEPLHLAAQHGHLAMVSYLLQQGFHPDSGTRIFHHAQTTTSSRIVSPSTTTTSSSTPLHRACYSGAIGCVKILLDHGADIMAKDNSFGDGMTPLHKAVKGGRYLAVAVILHHCYSQTKQQPQHCLLDDIMNCRDSQNRTPLELVKELNSKGQDEISSLRRWDQVAGGPASFQKCIDVLKQKQYYNSKCRKTWTSSVPPSYPNNDTPGIDFCKVVINHENDANNNQHNVYCEISQWERDFVDALLQSIQEIVPSNTTTATTTTDYNHEHFLPMKSSSENDNDHNTSIVPIENDNAQTTSTTTTTTTTTTTKSTSTSNTNPKVCGQPCHNCKNRSLTLFRVKSHHNQLFCPKCCRQRQHMS